MKIEEIVVTAFSKAIGEQVLAPVVGNGTFQSGAVKLAAAYFLGKKLKGLAKGVAYGIALDGAEDIIVNTGLLAKVPLPGGVAREEPVI